MKITKNKKATTATTEVGGTTFYPMTLDQVLDALKGGNVWLWKSFQKLGFEAVNGLWGSREVERDYFILCVTDGHEIKVKGKLIDPEIALDYYSEQELADYMGETTDDIIEDNFSVWEIRPPLYDKWAVELITEDGYDFLDLAAALEDMPD